MKKKDKFLIPIYGLKNSLKEDIKLDNNLLLRNINLLKKEHELFEEYGLRANYKAVLEVNYQYNSDNPSEPYPNISLNIVNEFDSALLVYGNGIVGAAGILPVLKRTGFRGYIIYSSKTKYEEGLNKDIDENFVYYYKKFLKAYSMRPMAFDVYRRSRDRFTNNDKTIDSCTVLESIFVPREERSKKSFILNGMKILGFKEEVKVIDDLIEYRNAIIHADIKKLHKLISGSKYNYDWFENTFKLMRKILSRYVEAPWN